LTLDLTIGEKDLIDLAFPGLLPHLKEKMEGQEFVDINLALQRVSSHENRAKDSRSYSRFKDRSSRHKEKDNMSYVDGEDESEGDNEICIAEWVETSKDKPISCSFLKPNGGRKDEMKYTFDVSKCDKLFDLLLRRGVIWLMRVMWYLLLNC
jgi:hypothetical protein